MMAEHNPHFLGKLFKPDRTDFETDKTIREDIEPLSEKQ